MIALGAMSGTSTDGVDVAALHIDPSNGAIRFLDFFTEDFSPSLRQVLLQLQRIPFVGEPLADPLVLFLQARHDLTKTYERAARSLLKTLGLDTCDIACIGAHGQTLRHRPELGYTYQMFDGALMAAKLGVDVVCDFRSKDIALGGQGAPLVPAFHQAWLASRGIHERAAVLNLGGFSNLTVLRGETQSVIGGDCGPANCLMDEWARDSFNRPFDLDGEIASRGQPCEALLDVLWSHPFFHTHWPKSTGRDQFSTEWLRSCLQHGAGGLSAEDVMATLLALTVRAVVHSTPKSLDVVYVCGGGVRNPALMNLLTLELAPVSCLPFENLGIPAQAVEAAAFAWMAVQRVQNKPSNCPDVTGAMRAGVLGALYSSH